MDPVHRVSSRSAPRRAPSKLELRRPRRLDPLGGVSALRLKRELAQYRALILKHGELDCEQCGARGVRAPRPWAARHTAARRRCSPARPPLAHRLAISCRVRRRVPSATIFHLNHVQGEGRGGCSSRQTPAKAATSYTSSPLGLMDSCSSKGRRALSQDTK